LDVINKISDHGNTDENRNTRNEPCIPNIEDYSAFRFNTQAEEAVNFYCTVFESKDIQQQNTF